MDMRLYHGTTRDNADEINRAGYLRGPVFLAREKSTAQSYGDVVFSVDVPEAELLIDLDLPGARLLTLDEANAYSDNPDGTLSSYNSFGIARGVNV